MTCSDKQPTTMLDVTTTPSRVSRRSQRRRAVNSSQPTSVRLGLTLVELLVLISVLVILTAVLVPSVRFLTKDRKIREATRELDTFLTSIQTDAIQTGTGGIWIERDPNTPNTATRLYRIKSPAPYTGDFFGAVCQIVEANANPAEVLNGIDDDGNSLVDDLYFANIRFDKNTAASVSFLAGPGDLIQFDLKGAWFTLTDVPAPGGDPNWTNTIRVVSSTGPINIVPPATPIVTKFKIRRLPKRSTVGYLELPQDTLIDLARSGFTAIDLNGNGLFDDLPIQGNEMLNQGALDPIQIIFGENGDVELVVINSTPVIPDRSLHLLLATDDRDSEEDLNPDYLTNPLVTTQTLEDLSNYWITINRQGTVSTTRVSDFTGANDPTFIGELLRSSRRNARLMESDGGG
jgi:type II secretory pathway pseudopilin PulG